MIYPKDLKEQVIMILTNNLLDMKELEIFKNTNNDNLIRYHFSLGMALRNHYKLWKQSVLDLYVEDLEFVDADDISYEWIIYIHKHINE